ncbi:MAG: helix-turn-helix domain-containing protein [Oscillospiraceae bacterium]
MITYDPLWKTMKEKGITTYTLRRKWNISGGTIDRLRKNQHISTYTIDILCNLIDCDVEDVMKQIRDK